MLQLIGTDGKRYYSWPLTPGRHIVGRQKDCEFHISHNTVSRRHAEVIVESETRQCFVNDLDSRNGTLVNNVIINERVPVQKDDRIMFGQTEFRVADADSVDGATPSRAKTTWSDEELEKSAFLSIKDALQPLPGKVTENPEFIPTILEMARMLVLREPEEVMLQKSLKMIARLIPAERFAVLFVPENIDDTYTAATLLPGGKDPGSFKLSRTIVREIINDKNAILLGDPLKDPRFAEQKSIIMSEMKSALAVPLFDEGRVLGILYADSTNPGHKYDDDHLRVLAACGNIMASRLLNYELLSEREEKRIMEAELDRAASIQKNLLVTSPPSFPGYDIHPLQEQSRSVGGDLYDVARLPDGRLLFVLADVSGKGLGAALLMSNILASFRILYEESDFSLTRVVERVSLQVQRFSAPGDYATLFIGLLEPDTGVLRYVNAGHNPPVLVRSDGSHNHLEATGLIIGAFDFASWSEESAEMRPGETLFVYSDGVTEAARDDLFYGEEKAEKMLTDLRDRPAREIVEGLMEDINNFMGEAPRSDDITIVAIKREKS